MIHIAGCTGDVKFPLPGEIQHQLGCNCVTTQGGNFISFHLLSHFKANNKVV